MKNKLKEVADSVERVQRGLQTCHPEGPITCYVKDLAEAVGCLVAVVNDLCSAPAPPKKAA